MIIRIELNGQSEEVVKEMQRVNGCGAGQLVGRALALKKGVDQLYREGFRKLTLVNEKTKEVKVIEGYEP
jgi:hypothetical protein